MRTSVFVLAFGFGCRSSESVTGFLRSEPSLDEAETVLAPIENSAQALHAVAAQIARVEVVDLSTRAVLATLDDETVDRLKSSIVADPVRTTLTVTPPPWDVVLHLHVPGRAPFVAHPVGFVGLRLRSDDPENPGLPTVAEGVDFVAAEVALDYEVSEVLHQLLGRPSKEYLLDDPGALMRFFEHE